MKVEDHDKLPKLNLVEPEGVRPQGRGEDVEWVITDSGTYQVAPGSFHYYFTKTRDGKKGVPFIQFDIPENDIYENPMAGCRVEIVNISSIVGIVYKPTKDDNG